MNRHIRFFHSIHFKIALVFALILLISLEVVGAVFVSQLEKRNVTQYERQLQLPRYLNRSLIVQLSRKNTQSANRRIHTLLANSNSTNNDQVQIIDHHGMIRGTNQVNNQSVIGEKTTDHDIKETLFHNKSVNRTTFNHQNNVRYYTMVEPLIKSQGNTVGAVYIRASLAPVYRTINSITLIYLIAALVTILIGLLVAIVIAHAITRPIDEMKQQTLQIAHGDYSGRVHVYGKDELGQLASAVNNLSVKVRESQESTESERRQLDSVLTNMNDGVFATDRRGYIVITNDKALAFLRLSEENVIGHSILQILKITKKTNWTQLLQHPKPIQIKLEQDDQTLILNAHFSLIQRISGFISGVVCVLHDVTEQQKIDAGRRRFVTDVSHELRTPLTGLHAYLETLQEGAWQDKEIAPHFLNVAQSETNRMIKMTNNLLVLSRLDSGTLKLNPELVNINKLFDNILQRYRDKLAKHQVIDNSIPVDKKCQIVSKISPHSLWVNVDVQRFQQVIKNLLNNALKYSPDGSKIVGSLYETQNHVLISIADQGRGIPLTAQKHIFDRFYRVDKSRARSKGGTGLGLSICKKIIEILGGSIWVESTLGKGATFYISLPYESVEEDLWDEEH